MTVAELIAYLQTLPQGFTVGLLLKTFRDPNFADVGMAEPPYVANGVVMIPGERV